MDRKFNDCLREITIFSLNKLNIKKLSLTEQQRHFFDYSFVEIDKGVRANVIKLRYNTLISQGSLVA